MKRALFGACLTLAALMPAMAQKAAQPAPKPNPAASQPAAKTPAQQPNEVVLQATSGAKLVLGMGAPALSGTDAATAEQEFSQVLRRDLEDSGLFSLVKENAPASTDAKAYKAWR